MPFTLESFCRTRPYAYHLTSSANFERIRTAPSLWPARELMAQSGTRNWMRTRRRGSKELVIDGARVWLRDQDPLHAGNVHLRGGWVFEDYLEELNSRVFFWPGGDDGPIRAGRNHFDRYEDERPVVLRVSTAALFKANRSAEPHFARYNTGAPRCNRGNPSPRGPNTFVSADRFDGTPSKVIELTYRERVILPEHSLAWAKGTALGAWRRL